jgi:polysaccharide deacetylase family protein (PEP-CTERM system associated)
MVIKNAMTIDVEDYFHVSAFEKHISRSHWSRLQCRIERNMDLILELLHTHNIHATFFMLGWVAENYPQIARSIVDNGHELASHGYHHVRVTNQHKDEFRQDITRTKKLLEDITSAAVEGYRAASYSIGEENLWAHNEMREAGYLYSSSIYPISHDHYGMPSAPRFTYAPIEGDEFLEIPITTANVFGRRLPGGGGGYFRLYPYWVSRWMLQRVNRVDGQPGIFYFHPWEIDPEQPRQNGIGMKTRFRHYLNLRKMEARLNRLFADLEWDRMDRVFLECQEADEAESNGDIS